VLEKEKPKYAELATVPIASLIDEVDKIDMEIETQVPKKTKSKLKNKKRNKDIAKLKAKLDKLMKDEESD